MEIPELIDIIYGQVLDKYRKQLEKDDQSHINKRVEKDKLALTQQLNDLQKELLDNYTLAVEDRLDYIYYKLNTYLLNLGIKYGMNLQKALDKHN